MKPGDFVLVQLVNPREKFWGPLHRVERIFADEPAGELLSFADRFQRAVGEDARYHLTPIPDTLDGD